MSDETRDVVIESMSEKLSELRADKDGLSHLVHTLRADLKEAKDELADLKRKAAEHLVSTDRLHEKVCKMLMKWDGSTLGAYSIVASLRNAIREAQDDGD